MLTKQAWSPYLAGVVIGLLQIPAFLLIETALGASSSYVTVGGMIASWMTQDRLVRCNKPVALSIGPRTTGHIGGCFAHHHN